MDAESTFALLARARAGDADALETLLRRCLPRLRAWASRRLPQWARDLADTDDLIQDTVVQTLRHVPHIEPRFEGALQAYLRQAVLNRIRSEFRRSSRRPAPEPLAPDHPDPSDSPLEVAIGREAVERYEAALERLRPEDREAIVARMELGYDYRELAEALGRPSPDAARVAVSRALVRLAREMRRGA